MQDHRKMDIWNLGKKLWINIYEVSSKLPDKEKFGLCSQLQRAAVSIPANIAEGAGRNGNADFANFLSISIGSVNEVTTLLEIVKDIGFIDQTSLDNLIAEYEHLKKMIINYRKPIVAKLKSKHQTSNLLHKTYVTNRTL